MGKVTQFDFDIIEAGERARTKMMLERMRNALEAIHDTTTDPAARSLASETLRGVAWR